MKQPSPRDFNVDQVRIIVPPDKTRDTALVLLSGMFPTKAIGQTSSLEAALAWFGRYLYPVTEPDSKLVSSRVGSVHPARRCLDELSTADGVGGIAVLDLVYVTHPVGGGHGTNVCGFATMSFSGTPALSSIALREPRYGTGQLGVAYQALQSDTPSATRDAVIRAVLNRDPHMPSSKWTAVVPLWDLIDGRHGVPTPTITVIGNICTYAEDEHDIWELMPRAAGADLHYDSHVASLSGTPYYRVFNAEPPTHQPDCHRTRRRG